MWVEWLRVLLIPNFFWIKWVSENVRFKVALEAEMYTA